MKKMLPLALIVLLSACCPEYDANRDAQLLWLRHTEQVHYRVEDGRIIYTAPDGSQTTWEASR